MTAPDAVPGVAVAGDLAVIGGGEGPPAAQLDRMAAALAAAGFAPDSLAALRAFYRPADWTEDRLTRALAAALPPGAAPVLSLVPVARAGWGPDRGTGGLTVEALSVAGPTLATVPGDHPAFPAGLRRGRFLCLGAVAAPEPGDFAGESAAVMRRLGATLAALGAGFGDVVKMNRWYHAEGTREAWAPSALAVAAFYAEPGPVATAISLPVPLPGPRRIRIELLGMRGADGAPLAKSHAWPEGLWDWPVHLPYKHGLACGGLGFVGGQVSLDAAAQVIDPDRLDLQVARSLDCIGRVAADLAPRSRALRHGVAYAVPPAGDPGWPALAALAQGAVPAAMAGYANLSYPDMRVEIEAILALG
jgi:enamine deaminase RidA (YjgF/YER057c/UK114 family)